MSDPLVSAAILVDVPSTSVRWGVLSTAAITDLIIPAICKARNAEIVAIASRELHRAERHARKYDIPRAYGSYQELLEDSSIDAVYVATPNSLHGDLVYLALRAGKHVLCEKPLTPTAAEATKLFELADTFDLRLGEAFMYRYHPQTDKLRRVVEEGLIGPVHSIHSSFYFRVCDPNSNIRYSRELAGGSLRDLGSYCVSISTFLLGAVPQRVWGVSLKSSTGVDVRFHGVLDFADGVVATVDCGLDSELFTRTTVVGREGVISLDNPFLPNIEEVWGDRIPPMAIQVQRSGRLQTFSTEGRSAYIYEIEGFSEAIQRGSIPKIDSDETLRNLRIIDALLTSADQERPQRYS